MVPIRITQLDPQALLADPAPLHATIRAALDYLGQLLRFQGELSVEVVVGRSQDNPLAGSSESVYAGLLGGLHRYESGLVSESRSGLDPTPARADLRLDINPDSLAEAGLWWDPQIGTSLSGRVPADRLDGFSVVLLQLLHAMGISGWRDPLTGALPADYQSAWDAGVQLQSGTASFVGPATQALITGGVELRLGDNQGAFSLGRGPLPSDSSQAWLQASLLNGYSLYTGERYLLGRLELALLQDVGWSPLPNLTLTDLSNLWDGVAQPLHKIGWAGDELLQGGELADQLEGRGGHDRLLGAGGDDRLDGGAGNDTLDGGVGNDRLLGGPGDDLFIVRDTGDVVVELAGEGVDTVQSLLAAYTLPAQVENGRIDLAGAANLSGNALDNLLRAGAGANVLNGGAGRDTADYSTAASAVVLNLAVLVPQATGGSGLDTVLGIENLIGSAFNDRLSGDAAANQLDGGAGHDTLDGGAGADRLVGGAGNDLFYVDNAGDQVVELAGGGLDTVVSRLPSYTLGAQIENARAEAPTGGNLLGNALDNLLGAGPGDNLLDGGAGRDTADYSRATAGVTLSLAVATAQVTGGSGRDTLRGIENLLGSPFADQLTGDAGANRLAGGAGGDRLTGGAGADVFVLDSTVGSDTVTDFRSGLDQLLVSMATLRVGDGDLLVERAVRSTGTGSFAPGAELVLLNVATAGSLSPAAAAAAIGSASSAYSTGATALFLLGHGSGSSLFRFSAANADALVAANELTLLLRLDGAPTLAATDLLFGP